ncbi:sensor histidine kinase [Pseudorhodobacter sp.]|uniref:sensor histidine kinase n=1 Tax=Pseudorhodobacter sp. TaxID=1934400 RepID=UPI00264988D0|nr:sensor histidine kinase [Pseudorhodobacter sp.]MDN5786479.1 sensor histidine kinase [Pseudorhodobacter sp.]
MKHWSLRSRLFVLIIFPLIIVACCAGAVRFVMAEHMSQRLYDNTLLAVALTISRDVVLSEGDVLTENLLESLTNALGDPVYYRIAGPEGRFVTGYSEAPPLPRDAKVLSGVPYFYDTINLGRRVRAVTLREFIAEPQFGGWVTVDVWQTVKQRDAFSLELLSQSIVLMAAVLVAAGLLVWFSINLGLRPLLQLREAIALRSSNDLGPIRRKVPKEVRNLVGAMNALFGRLAEAFDLRDAFISDAAHQLRNPIAAIQAQAEAATTAPDEAELRARVAVLAETARATGRLTQQLLSMEKAQGRRGLDTRSEVDLVALLKERCLPLAETCMRKGCDVSFDVNGAPVLVSIDEIMMSEAIENLLDNAVRYGCVDGGEISVRLTFAQDHVIIRVQDSGPGIPADARERLFDRFYRVQDDASGGCGLGLAIVRDVAIGHRGQVHIVDSEIGAVFEMRIPIAT